MFDIVSENLSGTPEKRSTIISILSQSPKPNCIIFMTIRIQRFVPKNRPKLLLQNTEKFDNFLTTTRKCTKVCNVLAEPLYRSLNLSKRRSELRNSALTFKTGRRPEKFENAASDDYC